MRPCRNGESPNVTVPIAERLKQAVADRAALVQKKQALQARIDALANGLLLQQDPSRLVGSMDGRQPIALLPMRIETRYVPAVQPNAQVRPDRLRIRVYPDDINTIEHEAALTVAEQKGGADYWNSRFAHADDEAARTLRDLGTAFGRGRAALIVRVMTPTNAVPAVDAEPVGPQFPDVDTIDALAKATRAVLLPDRWVAIGYAAGRREVFRAWGNRIADELLLSPDWLATDDPEALLGGERAWMVDFDAALANGMALEITQDDVNSFALRNHAPRFTLATDTIDRLVVFGLEWTKSPDDSVAEFTDLLAAHRDSTGLGFVPLGTPTNNTEAAPSGYSAREERAAPTPPASRPAEKDALQLTTWAFGIDPTTPARRPDRQRAPRRAAHRAAHDERAVARHDGPLAQRTVELARRREDAADQDADAVRPAALRGGNTCGRPDRCRCCASTRSRTRSCRWSASASSTPATRRSRPASRRSSACCARCGSWPPATCR